jgi:hypothetical protein
MNLASSLVVVTLVTGCASGVGSARTHSPPPPQKEPANAAGALSGPKQLELRHFYLLSPGPNATLVITRRDVPDAESGRMGDVGNLHQPD